jgi:hypothetical protein
LVSFTLSITKLFYLEGIHSLMVYFEISSALMSIDESSSSYSGEEN